MLIQGGKCIFLLQETKSRMGRKLRLIWLDPRVYQLTTSCPLMITQFLFRITIWGKHANATECAHTHTHATHHRASVWVALF